MLITFLELWKSPGRNIFRKIHLDKVKSGDIPLYSYESFRAKIVLVASDYLYSSASNYVGKKSIFNGVVLIEHPIIDPIKNNWTHDLENW